MTSSNDNNYTIDKGREGLETEVTSNNHPCCPGFIRGCLTTTWKENPGWRQLRDKRLSYCQYNNPPAELTLHFHT